MNIFSSLKIATDTLRTNRPRTFLTVLGVVIGISSVIVILSAGEAMKRFMLDEMEAFGSNIIQAEIKVPSTEHQSAENAVGIAMGVSITTMKHSDTEEIAKLPNIDKAYSAVMGQSLAVYGSNNKITTLYGITAPFIEIDKTAVAVGRFFTEDEDRSLSRVAVLGYDIKEDLFGDREALGKNIKIGRQNFRVIGVMEKRGAAMFFNWDELIYLPLRTLQKRIMGIDYITFLIATMVDPRLDQVTKAEIEDILRERHNITDPKKDDFAVTTQAEMQDLLSAIMDGIQLLLIAVASISLIVGGVGIMNIMYVSVAERTYEIGLRKSVGATKSDILWQFLWEAIFITAVGGVVGIVVGVTVAWLLAMAAQSYGYNFQFFLSWWSVLVACGFAVIVGLVFGIYPARQAAKLDPITALRK